MMTITPFAVTQGPADMYWAVFGTADPVDTLATVAAGPPPVPWVGIGGTETGIMCEIDVTVTDIKVDQVIDPIGGRVTDRSITVKTQMKETTLSNLSLVLNQATTITVGAGWTAMELQNTSAATQPQYAALVFDGWAPTLSTSQPARRRFVVRKVLSKPKAQLNYEKAKSAIYDVTFQAYWVSTTITPFRVTDQTA